MLDGQSIRLTQAALETLAVVAYKQPVTRSRMAAIRGVNCDGVMRTLVTRGLIEECGTQPETGAHLYRTTTAVPGEARPRHGGRPAAARPVPARRRERTRPMPSADRRRDQPARKQPAKTAKRQHRQHGHGTSNTGSGQDGQEAGRPARGRNASPPPRRESAPRRTAGSEPAQRTATGTGRAPARTPASSSWADRPRSAAAPVRTPRRADRAGAGRRTGTAAEGAGRRRHRLAAGLRGADRGRAGHSRRPAWPSSATGPTRSRR